MTVIPKIFDLSEEIGSDRLSYHEKNKNNFIIKKQQIDQKNKLYLESTNIFKGFNNTFNNRYKISFSVEN